MPADRGRYLPPAVALPSPPAGCLVPGLLLPQACRSREITPPDRRWLKPAGSVLTNARWHRLCLKARHWLNARRITADSSPPDRRWLKPAGSPLTQACRIAADSSLQDRRWLKPAGSPLTQARRIAADSLPAGSPLTQARRIAADSSPPDRRWLNARRIAADSSPPATAIPSPVDQVHMSRPGVPCCFVVPTGTF